jgi:dihydroneopterin aldolase
MGKIKLKNIRCYSFHGCLKEETKIGSEYLVNLTVKANLKKSSGSDNLKDTVDYVLLNKIVKEQMSKPSKLLESVAKRILDAVFINDNMVVFCSVDIAKICPPINGDVESVSVKLAQKRDCKI